MVSATNSLQVQNYNWPCVPFDEQHWINGTFCENRSGASGPIDHFHDGVDIHLPEGEEVYSVIDGAVTSIGTPSQYGINSWVRVGRYAYVHVIPSPALSTGDSVSAFETILGTTNDWNHIHFKDGYPGEEINALRKDGGLSPFDDSFDPGVESIQFYIDGTDRQFTDRKVNGKVDIVSRTADVTDTGPIGGNNGIYRIGFDITDESGAVVFGPVIPFQFDQIPSSDDYITNVYAKGSTTSIYRYIVSNQITYSSSVDVTHWDRGDYTARVYAWDTRDNADTMKTQFEVVDSDTVPPVPPTLLAVIHDGEGFQIQWLRNLETDLIGYRLYFSYDLENWTSYHNESELTETVTELYVSTFPENVTIFFRLTAVDNAPFTNESESSNIYGLRLGNPDNRFIIVDAFDRVDGAWSRPSHPFAALLGEHLGEAGFSFATVDDDLFGIDTTFFLHSLHAPGKIIYTLDDVGPLPPKLIQELEVSHDGTWLIGSRLMEAFSLDSLGQEYLESVGLSSGSIVSTPEVMTGLWGRTFQIDSSFYVLDSLNTVQINPDAGTTILEDTDGNSFGALGSKFLYTAPPPEILFASDSDDNLMEEIAHALLHDLRSEDSAILPDRFSMVVYPNPFNSASQIRFNAPGRGSVDIALYSVLGQRIWSKKIEVGGPSHLTQPLSQDVINSLASGVYLVRGGFTSHNSIPPTRQTEKIVFIK
tara:strand:- start:5892 stop:8003 length:2112 start_codon:yes stop_codon:yes gene_type:complete